jgi:hypothetical protein
MSGCPSSNAALVRREADRPVPPIQVVEVQRGDLATPHPVADEQEHYRPVTGRHPIRRQRPEQAADILLARPLRHVA